MQEDEPTAFVSYDRFEQKMLELLETGEYAPDCEDTLLAAFRVSSVLRTAVKLLSCCCGDVVIAPGVRVRRSTPRGRAMLTLTIFKSCCAATSALLFGTRR
jgi:hypothetical protein